MRQNTNVAESANSADLLKAQFVNQYTLESSKDRGAILSPTSEEWSMNMPGIEFLRDRKGRRKAVLIDLKKHKQLWEDLYDAYLAHSRRGERRESLTTVKRLIEARAKRKARG